MELSLVHNAFVLLGIPWEFSLCGLVNVTYAKV